MSTPSTSQSAKTAPNSVWRVRPAGTSHPGKATTYRRLSEGIGNEEVGDLDEVCGPGESTWMKVAEHPLAAMLVPRPRSIYAKLEEDPETDMTPMIDVTFQLLIFFMICATYIVQKTLDWPGAKPDSDGVATVTLDELDRTHVLVKITADGDVSIDGKGVSIANIESELASAIKQTGSAEVLLDVDDNAGHDVFVQVLDAAGGAQVEQILYVSRAKSKGTSKPEKQSE